MVGMNDLIAAAFVDPLGYEAGRLCEHLDLLVPGLSEEARQSLQRIEKQIASEIRFFDADVIVKMLHKASFAMLRSQLRIAGIPDTPMTVGAIVFVNWPLPVNVIDDVPKD